MNWLISSGEAKNVVRKRYPAAFDKAAQAFRRWRVHKSRLWNQNRVEETYDPAFLKTLERIIWEMGRSA